MSQRQNGRTADHDGDDPVGRGTGGGDTRGRAPRGGREDRHAAPRDLARGLGWARVLIGAATYALPKLSARLLTGPSADLAGVAFGVRGMGARDLAVGLGVIRARTDREAADWLSAAALIDLSDTVTLLLAFRRMPLVRNLILISMALGGAAAELYLSGRLRDE